MCSRNLKIAELYGKEFLEDYMFHKTPEKKYL
jgi:hypothetical protein